ncbi:uncharacterized protein [Malus domestica]|uniref:uncharacterized protein isoform X2 n=1 Tax=Malus domestica TaxID=3750 RepID=UPI0039766584
MLLHWGDAVSWKNAYSSYFWNSLSHCFLSSFLEVRKDGHFCQNLQQNGNFCQNKRLNKNISRIPLFFDAVKVFVNSYLRRL